MISAPTYHVPPVCQGQIVERAYAQVGDVLLVRAIDKSDGSVDYWMVALHGNEIESIEPWNDEPIFENSRHVRISAAMAERIAEEGP